LPFEDASVFLISLFQAYWQAEHHRAEKEETKRQAEVLKRWTRLVQGLRIRQRLVEQYKDRGRQEQRDPQGGDETNAERKLEV
jgi:xeroderma pigmentosum group C-complementing protein